VPSRALLPWRSAIVDCGVRPRNILSFASSALRSMMLGTPLPAAFSGSAVRGAKAMPCTSRNDGHHPGAQYEGPGRPVIADDVQGLRAVENVNQFVLGMIFPMTCSRGLTGDKDAVAV